MSNITYTVRTDSVPDEDGKLHTVYGINVIENDRIIRFVPDIFFNKEKAEAFARMCTRLGVSSLHLMDVIEDAMV